VLALKTFGLTDEDLHGRWVLPFGPPGVANIQRISYTDLDGVRHSVEVTADSLYEAAVLGLRALKRSAWIESVGPSTRLEIQVIEPAAVHVLLVSQLTRWLDGGAPNPADLVKKKKLKELLAS
jgi:hypothetical protein